MSTGDAFACAFEHHKAGRLTRAEELYRDALRVDPNAPMVLSQLAAVVWSLGRLEEAIELQRRAVSVRPDFFEGWYNLGNNLLDAGQLDAARQAISRAIGLRPASAEAACAMGNCLLAGQEFEEAQQYYQRSLQLKPALVESHFGLGSVLCEMGRPQEAVEEFSTCIRVQPGNVPAQRGLAAALANQGRFDDALAIYEQLYRQYPSDPEIGHELGWELLLRGDWLRAWPLYECRLDVPRLAPRGPAPFPLWDGNDLDGKRILIHAEQGFGDTFQFVRYLPLVQAKGGRVVFRCQSPLKALLDGQFGAEVTITDDEPMPDGIETQYPLLSLASRFGTVESTIPSAIPYIHAPPTHVRQWNDRIGLRRAALRVGILWAGNPAHGRDRRRSIYPPLLTDMVSAFGSTVEWFNFQKRSEGTLSPVVLFGERFRDYGAEFTDFAQTAGLLAHMDLLISVDTSVAHLAGAMGMPVWVMLPFVPDWRWQFGRLDSPWYPTMRLFRQPELDDWATVLENVSAALRQKLDNV